MIPRPIVHVLLSDEDERGELARRLERAGYEAVVHGSDGELLAAVEAERSACVVADTASLSEGAAGFQRRLVERAPRATAIFIADEPTVDEAVTALRHGAGDFLIRPVDPAVLIERINEVYDTGLDG